MGPELRDLVGPIFWLAGFIFLMAGLKLTPASAGNIVLSVVLLSIGAACIGISFERILLTGGKLN